MSVYTQYDCFHSNLIYVDASQTASTQGQQLVTKSRQSFMVRARIFKCVWGPGIDCLVNLTIWKSRTYVHIRSSPAKENYTPENPPNSVKKSTMLRAGGNPPIFLVSLYSRHATRTDVYLSTSGDWFS
jgi:hypothetical protein